MPGRFALRSLNYCRSTHISSLFLPAVYSARVFSSSAAPASSRTSSSNVPSSSSPSPSTTVPSSASSTNKPNSSSSPNQSTSLSLEDASRVHTMEKELTSSQRKHMLKLRWGAAIIPKKEKVTMRGRAVVEKEKGHGGEDAYLCVAGRNSYFIGVADGVSEWDSLGIDAGQWSRSLLESVRGDVQQQGADALDPLQLLQSAYDTNINNKVLGSSTACFLSLASIERELSTANLGNSGYLLLRLEGEKLKLIHKSGTQEHNFGCPFQLGHHTASSKPADALVASHSVLPGDMIVVGSDGLFDNLSNEEISEIILPVLLARWEARQNKVNKAIEKFDTKEQLSQSQCVSLANQPGDIATKLANVAFGASLDKKRATPFSMMATSELNMVYNGGKQDDITVVVAFVELDVTL